MKHKKLFISWLFILVITQSCSLFFVTDQYDEDPRMEDFESTWSVFNKWYPYFDYKKISWDSIRDVYRPLILDSYSDEHLLVIHKMLLELKDGHVAIKFKDGRNLGYSTPRQIRDKNKFDFKVTREYITSSIDSLMGTIVYYGLLSDIGYMRISTFSGSTIDEWRKSISLILANFDTTSGLIIDVRHNGGGSTSNAIEIIKQCIQQPIETPGWNEKGTFQKGPVINPVAANNYSNPIVVLINGKSFSSTEHFAMWLQHTGYIKLIGDTTGGGAGNPFYSVLPSGNEVRVPTRFFYRYDGQPIEWNGIVPNYLVEQSEVDLKNGKDSQLEYAIDYLTTTINKK